MSFIGLLKHSEGFAYRSRDDSDSRIINTALKSRKPEHTVRLTGSLAEVLTVCIILGRGALAYRGPFQGVLKPPAWFTS